MVEKPKDEDIRMDEINTKRDHARYTFQDKARFFDLKIEKYMTAAAATKQLGIHARTAQRWLNNIMRVLIAFLRVAKK